MIAPGHSFVWSSPRAPIILAKSLMLKDQALRFRLSADPRLYAWTWGFLKECTAAKARRNTLLKHRLAAYSQTVLDERRRRRGDRLRPQHPRHSLLPPRPEGARRRRRAHEATGVGRPGDQGAYPRPGDRARAGAWPTPGRRSPAPSFARPTRPGIAPNSPARSPPRSSNAAARSSPARPSAGSRATGDKVTPSLDRPRAVRRRRLCAGARRREPHSRPQASASACPSIRSRAIR